MPSRLRRPRPRIPLSEAVSHQEQSETLKLEVARKMDEERGNLIASTSPLVTSAEAELANRLANATLAVTESYH